jgi:hypothetical protein
VQVPVFIRYGIEVVRGKHKRRDPVHVPKEFWQLYADFTVIRSSIYTWILSEFENLVTILEEDQNRYDLLPGVPPKQSPSLILLNYLGQAEVAISLYTRNLADLQPLLVEHDKIHAELLPLWLTCRTEMLKGDKQAYEVCRRDIEESHRLLPYLKGTTQMGG